MRWFAVLLVACSSASEPAPVEQAEPASPPEELWATIDFGGGDVQRLYEALDAPVLRAVLPATPRALVERIDERPRNVDAQAPVRVAVVDGHVAIGFGSAGRREAVAEHEPLLRDVGAWLRQPIEADGINIHVADTAMQELRQYLDGALNDQLNIARAGIRTEASRHDEAPAYGDPEALVNWVATRLRSYIAFVPDVRDLHLSVETRPLRIEGQFTTLDDSPAARALAAEEVASVPTLPRGAALGWWRAQPRPGWTELLETTAGERLSQSDRETLREYAGTNTQGQMIAIGHDGDAFALVQTSASVPDFEPLLRVQHVRTLLGLFRCEQVRNPRFGSPLCADGPYLQHNDANHQLIVSDRESFEMRPPEPDAQRVVPSRASGVIFVDAPAMAAATALWRQTGALPRTSAPIALSWSAGERSTFELRFAPGSVTAFADATMAATDP